MLTRRDLWRVRPCLLCGCTCWATAEPARPGGVNPGDREAVRRLSARIMGWRASRCCRSAGGVRNRWSVAHGRRTWTMAAPMPGCAAARRRLWASTSPSDKMKLAGIAVDAVGPNPRRTVPNRRRLDYDFTRTKGRTPAQRAEASCKYRALCTTTEARKTSHGTA